MTKIRCKLGGYSPVVMGTTYHFSRDPDLKDADGAPLYTAEVIDEKHVDVLLAVVHYERVTPLDPAAEALPPPPAPVGLTYAELMALVEQAGNINIEQRTVDGLKIYVVTGPWPEIVGVANEMMQSDATWYTITGDQLHVDVMNGRARYLLQGKIEAGGVFKLDGTPFFEAPPEADTVALLPGSAALVGPFKIRGADVGLTDIIAAVVEDANYTPEDWNDLSEAERDALIQDYVGTQTEEPASLQQGQSNAASAAAAEVAPAEAAPAVAAKKPRRSRKPADEAKQGE